MLRRHASLLIVLAATVACATAASSSTTSKLLGLTDFYPICDQVTLLGYPCESHSVPTADGFVLNVIRIPPKSGKGYPVYLQHGLLDSAISWVGNANGFQNLGCILHDEGYDVYMANARGNHYSMNNTQYPQSDPMFWKMIDMDWMARYDLPAVIDFALATSQHSTLTYMGHSQGGMMGFAGFGHWNKDYASKVDLFIGLAPACYVGHTTSFLVRLLADFDVATLFQIFGQTTFLSNDWLLRQMTKFCADMGGICPDLLSLFMGDGNPANINQTQLQVYTRYDPAGTSVNNMIHWQQEVLSGKFQAHDYGSDQNMMFYNQSTAPEYDLTQMTGPKTVIFSGTRDALADPQDVAMIVANVPPTTLLQSTVIPGFAHLDFVWGLDAYSVLYPQLLALVAQHKS